MFVANIAWGLMAPLSKMAMSNPAITSWILVSFRVLGAAGAFWLTGMFVRKEKVATRDLGLLALAAVIGIIMNQGVFILGVSLTSPVNASIITTTLPIVTMILSALYLREPITWLKFGGILVGASGALLLILGNPSSHGHNLNHNDLWGIGLCLLSQFCYATYFVLFKKLVSRYHPVTSMKWMFLFASLIYIPFNLPQLAHINYSGLPTGIVADILFVVFGSTFLAYMMIPVGQKNLRPTVATMYNYLQPIVATAVAIFWQLDRFSGSKVLSILLVFLGVFLVNKSRARADA